MNTRAVASTAFARRSLPVDPMRGRRVGIAIRPGIPRGSSAQARRSFPGCARRAFGLRRLRVSSASVRSRLGARSFGA